jgi:hypothetical protein
MDYQVQTWLPWFFRRYLQGHDIRLKDLYSDASEGPDGAVAGYRTVGNGGLEIGPAAELQELPPASARGDDGGDLDDRASSTSSDHR